MPTLDVALSQGWSQELVSLLAVAAMPDLDGSPRDPTVRKAIEGFIHRAKPGLTKAAESGLWLMVGELDRSHEISQEMHDADGSFWHGIMHRREGDFWNSKYWMRKVGNHPVVDELQRRFPEYEDPFVFVDLCEACVQRRQGDRERLKHIQWAEWQLLFSHAQ